MSVFQIKRNDTKPFLAVQFTDSTGSAIDLTDTTGISFNLATNDNQFTSVLSGAAVITGSTTGNVQYEWSASDTNRSGLYLGEFEATFNDATILTLPSDNSLVVKINEDYD
jgi:hypothetical protein